MKRLKYLLAVGVMATLAAAVLFVIIATYGGLGTLLLLGAGSLVGWAAVTLVDE